MNAGDVYLQLLVKLHKLSNKLHFEYLLENNIQNLINAGMEVK